ncbi:MAG TPA: DUF481 domain-containing protein [Chryseolinea sp.]|nr:DUF481 domain-containing protein [Chryseolinea sp.]
MSAYTKIWLLGLITIFIASGPAFGQFNDSINHYIYIGSTGTYSKTNDLNSYVLANNVKFTVSKKRFSFYTANSWVYGKQSEVTSNNDFSSLVEFDFLKNEKRLYYWGNGTFDKSYSLKIDYRYQAGAGLGFNIVKNDKVLLNVTEGILYEEGSLIDKDLGDRNYDVWRNSARFKYRWVIQDIVILDGFVLYQPSISSRHDTIFKSATTLSVKVRKWISLSSALTYNEITLTDRRNLIVTYGVIMERFF